MPKYVDMEARLEIKAEELFVSSGEQQELPKGGIFVVSDGEVSFKEIEKPSETTE